jgi:alanyl-tRNA synthetase
MVRSNIKQKASEKVALKKALSMGAMALFGEKYGDSVRVVEFGDSIELCGGTHTESTGGIGVIKVVSEGAIAAGVRRIEALTGVKAFEYINERLAAADDIALLLKTPGNIREGVEKLMSENAALRKTVEKLQARSAADALKAIENKVLDLKGVKYFSGEIEVDNPDILKTIAFDIRKKYPHSVVVLGSSSGGKANLAVAVSDSLVSEMKLNAVNIIKEIAGEINGGGGGQPFLATAGGKKPEGIHKAISKATDLITRYLS